MFEKNVLPLESRRLFNVCFVISYGHVSAGLTVVEQVLFKSKVLLAERPVTECVLIGLCVSRGLPYWSHVSREEESYSVMIEVSYVRMFFGVNYIAWIFCGDVVLLCPRIRELVQLVKTSCPQLFFLFLLM